ncbi:MAG: DNA translocase FtsK 4TM domain-containing protein, partial [Eubacterium sp.]|nr:DNA translocase FtsK 4TM domain-containing protein [Eubacterium sp.]
MAGSNNRGNASRKTAKNSENEERSPIRSEVLFLVVLVVALLVAISLFGWGGVVGRGVSYVLFGLFGAVAYLIPVLLILIGGVVILNSPNDRVRHKGWYAFGFFMTLCGVVQWFFNSDVKDVWDTFTHSAVNHSRGGFFGGLFSIEISKLLGRVGDLILLLGLLLLFFILFSRKLLFSTMKTKVQDKHEQRKRNAAIDERDLADRQMQIHTFDATMRQEAKAHVAPQKNEPSIAPKLEPDEGAEPVKKTKSRRKKEMKDSAVLESVAPELPETDKERALQDVHIRGMSRELDSEDGNIAERELEEKFGKSEADEGCRTQSGMLSLSTPDKSPQKASPAAGAVKDSKSFSAGELSKSTQSSETIETPPTASDAEEADNKPKVPEPIPYEFPPVELLSKPKASSRRMSEKELKE